VPSGIDADTPGAPAKEVDAEYGSLAADAAEVDAGVDDDDDDDDEEEDDEEEEVAAEEPAAELWFALAEEW
jgi:hypothetical protein